MYIDEWFDQCIWLWMVDGLASWKRPCCSRLHRVDRWYQYSWSRMSPWGGCTCSWYCLAGWDSVRRESWPSDYLRRTVVSHFSLGLQYTWRSSIMFKYVRLKVWTFPVPFFDQGHGIIPKSFLCFYTGRSKVLSIVRALCGVVWCNLAVCMSRFNYMV